MDVDGAREEAADVGGANDRAGEPRSEDAADGGGRRAVEGFGGDRDGAVFVIGRGGGGIRLGAGFKVPVAEGEVIVMLGGGFIVGIRVSSTLPDGVLPFSEGIRSGTDPF